MWGREEGKPGLASGQRRQVYLFSGLLRCGQCGGSITLVSGRRRNGAESYGCSLHQQRGDSVCRNDLYILRDDLEVRLLRRLQETVLREEVIDYPVDRRQQELDRWHDELDSKLDRLHDEKKHHETEIGRLVDAIATGKGGQSLTQAIAERERKIQQITNRLLEPGPGSLHEK